MRHPILLLPRIAGHAVTALLILASLGMGQLMLDHGELLRTSEARAGILCFELPVTAQKATDIRSEWQEEGLIRLARDDIRLDFLFLLIYPLAFSAFLALASQSKSTGRQALNLRMAWLSLAMIPLDAAENLLMLRMLEGKITTLTAAVTTSMAALKFLILGLAALLAIRVLLLLARNLLELVGRKLRQS